MSAATFTKLMSIDDGGTTGSCLYADVTNGTETTSAFDFESYRVSDTSNRTNLDRINYARCIGNLA
jgi:hypothetical protein